MANINNVGPKIAVALTANWVEVPLTMERSKGVLIYNYHATGVVYYDLVGSGETPPSGAGAKADSIGEVFPGKEWLNIGGSVRLFMYSPIVALVNVKEAK